MRNPFFWRASRNLETVLCSGYTPVNIEKEGKSFRTTLSIYVRSLDRLPRCLTYTDLQEPFDRLQQQRTNTIPLKNTIRDRESEGLMEQSRANYPPQFKFGVRM
jgi:hypothetical protein